jgi:hypothetical protein
MRRRAATVAVLLLGISGLLQACQSNPEPPPLETAASSPPAPPTSSPTEAAPTLPAAAKGRSEAAAKAFVRHYFTTLNYAMNTGTIQPLEALSDKRCESCSAIARNIESTYAAGGHIESRGWLLNSISPVPRQPVRRPIFDLGVRMTTETVTRKAGEKARKFEGGKQPMTIHLLDSGGSWRVLRLDLIS